MYTIQISQEGLLLARRGLGLLPHDEVRTLIEDLAEQVFGQDKKSSFPPLPLIVDPLENPDGSTS